MTRGHPSDRLRLGVVALIAFAAVAGALVSQHRFDMQPCPWCIVQRMLFCLIGLAGVVGAAWPMPRARPAHLGAASFIGAASVLGASSALWQQLFAAKSSSCSKTVADIIVSTTRLDTLLPEIFQSRASCAEGAVNMLGVPYALWSLAVFLVTAIAALKMHLEQRQRVVIADSSFGV